MSTFPYEVRETRRIILLRLQRGTAEVFLGSDRSGRTLPHVQIERSQRVAPQLSAGLKETRGIEAVSVSSLEVHHARNSDSEHIAYELMQPLRPEEQSQRDKCWVAIDSLTESGFDDRNDFRAVRKALAQSITSAKDASCGPFASLGWFRELEQWVQEELRPQGLHVSGRFRQLNASPTFSLIRFETDGCAIWFKAVGAPNQREYALTLALACSFPRFLPEVIATRTDWNGWLSREAEGPLLSECAAPEVWEGAARSLAELQIQSLGKSGHLLDRGARDLRTSTLTDLAEPYIETMGDVMKRQTKAWPSPFSRDQLRCLATRVLDALALLDRANIPPTLGHLDLNPENIVCSPGGCMFLDWAEGFAGHPFLTFEYLREHFRRSVGQENPRRPQLLTSYVSQWRALVAESDILDALDVAPLVAVFACAVGNDLWTNPRKLEEPRTAAYLRSLTRRMLREANALAERSQTCQN